MISSRSVRPPNSFLTRKMKHKPYHIGMYGGKFLPFHLGHRYCVEYAAKECDIVYVILFWGGAEEEEIRKACPQDWLSAEERRASVKSLCEELSRVPENSAKIIAAEIDIRELRLPDGSEDWEAETPLVRALCGDRLDAVYSSEESYGDYFSHAYPEAVHRLVDVPRIHYPISGTKIRAMQDTSEQKKWML